MNHNPSQRSARFILLIVITAWTMQACVHAPTATPMPGTQDTCDAAVSPADRTKLVAIEQMIMEGQVYAALARIETLNSSAPLVRLTQAEALRRTETPDQAQNIYTELLGSCHRGRAHHGLGLLLAKQGEDASSLDHLRQARIALPTDPRVRSDLGFALLLAGRLPEARFEFLTALDLDPRDTRAARNLLLLMLKQGESDKAQEMADRLGLDKATMDKLVKEASELPPASVSPSFSAPSAVGVAS